MKKMLVKFVGAKKETWDEHLDSCVFAYNTSRQESTLHSPFEVMFGRLARLPIEVDTQREDNIQRLDTYLKEPKVTTCEIIIIYSGDNNIILIFCNVLYHVCFKQDVSLSGLTERRLGVLTKVK